MSHLKVKMTLTLRNDCSPGPRMLIRVLTLTELVHVLAFGTPIFYIAPYDKIKHELINLSSNCDVKSGLNS